MKAPAAGIQAVAVAVLLTACGPGEAPGTPPRAVAAGQEDGTPSARELLFTVYKSPTCGCCTKWAEYMEANGYAVELVDTDDLGAIKDRLGVPRDLRSCHTATLGDYVIEGHVPVTDIRRLLATEPRGILGVPGMPLGSPGMEDPRGSQPYDSVLVRADGRAEIFAHHPASEP